MGRSEPLGKTVKKWLMQGKDLFFIFDVLSGVVNTPNFSVETLYFEYLSYIGKTPFPKTSENLFELVKNCEKVQLYGEVGVGKSYFIEEISKKLKLTLLKSTARSEEDLVNDWGDAPFSEEGDFLFVLEGDHYYYRTYGLLKRYLNDSKFPIVIITNEKKKPTKNITKYLKQVKVFPPTRADVLKMMMTINPSFDGNIQEIYSKDWRKVWLKVLYDQDIEDVKKSQKIQAKNLAYKICKGIATVEDFDNCEHPMSFTLNWLGHNAVNFWKGSNLNYALDVISWCDANKYSHKKEFIRSALMHLIPMDMKGYLSFPPFRREQAQEVEEKNFEIMKIKKKKRKITKKKEIVEDEDDLSDFLLV